MSNSKSVAEVETGSSKKFIVMKQDGTSLLKVGLEGGGVVPKELSETMFTSVKVAQEAIEAYLTKRSK